MSARRLTPKQFEEYRLHAYLGWTDNVGPLLDHIAAIEEEFARSHEVQNDVNDKARARIEELEAELADKYCWARAKDAEHRLATAQEENSKLKEALYAYSIMFGQQLLSDAKKEQP